MVDALGSVKQHAFIVEDKKRSEQWSKFQCAGGQCFCSTQILQKHFMLHNVAGEL